MASRASGAKGKEETEKAKAKCDICRRDSFPESLLACNRCITIQHTFCLPIPLVALPGPKWSCAACSESYQRAYPTRTRKSSNGAIGGSQASAKSSSNGVEPLSNGIAKPSSIGSQANGSQAKGSHANGSKANGSRAKGSHAKGSQAKRSQANGSQANGSQANGSQANGKGMEPPPPEDRKRPRESPQRAADATSTSDVAPASGSALPAQASGACSPDNERGDPSYNPGTTVTIFCRRDLDRYLRWKARKLASQDEEKKREEETRARKTFSSIIANSKT